MTSLNATKTLLQVNSSPRVGQSLSSQLADELVARYIARHPGTRHVLRDLGRQPHPVLDEVALGALFTPAAQRTPEQAARVALDDALIAEIQAADVVVVAAPMFNFGVSAQLKNWIDAISRAQVTFRYTEHGPEGLLKGKQVFVVLTRGGKYRGQPSDSQVPYLKTVFGFLGMTQVEFIYAEGLALGAEAAAAALAEARAQIDALLPPTEAVAA